MEPFFPFLANFVHLTSSGFAHFSVGWWREQGQAGCGGEMFRKSLLLFSLFEGFPFSINVAYNHATGWFEIVNNSMVEWHDNFGLINGLSDIPYTFEILEVFFENKNITWINCNYTKGWYDYETGRWTGTVGKVKMNTFLLK